MEKNKDIQPEMITGKYCFQPPKYTKRQEIATALFGKLLDTIDNSGLCHLLRDMAFYRSLFKRERAFHVPHIAGVEGFWICDKEFKKFNIRSSSELGFFLGSREYKRMCNIRNHDSVKVDKCGNIVAVGKNKFDTQLLTQPIPQKEKDRTRRLSAVCVPLNRYLEDLN